MEEVKSAKRMACVEPPEIVKAEGEVRREWMRAQSEMQKGKQPEVCVRAKVRLDNIGRRRHLTTVHGLENFLSATVRGKAKGFTIESADYTDDEMGDDDDEEEQAQTPLTPRTEFCTCATLSTPSWIYLHTLFKFQTRYSFESPSIKSLLFGTCRE